MAVTCPVEFDTHRLRSAVNEVYTRVAGEPGGAFHFHHGGDDAVRLLGYDAEALAELPAAVVARFAGVGNPHRVAPINDGETVLDIGCGAGVDLLLAARRVAPRGRAIGVDMTEAMRECAHRGAAELGLDGVVELRAGLAEQLPAEDGSVDVVISNGVLNLAVDKHRAFSEIVRVLRRGRRLQLADVVVERELSLRVRKDADLWAA